MKMWEMVKELTENPGKRFKSDDYEAYVDDGLLEVTFVAKVTDFSIFIDREWEEVKEPVAFIEAVKSGKKISIEHENLFDMPVLYKKKTSISTVLSYITENYCGELVREILLNGKWYIED